MDYKICKVCGNLLPLNEFSKDKWHKDGHRNDCKKCHRKYNKQYYQECHDELMNKHRGFIKKYRKTLCGRAMSLANNYKTIDKKYGRDNNIDGQWILDNIFTKKCIYCGESDWTKLGCDRIDNTKGHTTDNVVCSCWNCNNERQKTNFEEFFKKKKGLN